MNLLDLLLAVIIGISVATGFMAGFARVGVGFIASISGLFFGFWYYNVPATWLREHWTMSVNLSNMLGFFVVFLMFLTAGAMIGKLLSKLFKWTGLGWLDRLLGGAFGLLRGAPAGGDLRRGDHGVHAEASAQLDGWIASAALRARRIERHVPSWRRTR